MTSGSPMHATIRTGPAQAEQVHRAHPCTRLLRGSLWLRDDLLCHAENEYDPSNL